MRFRNRRTPSADIDLTPLIDVVFLLLIFFMVSTTFSRNSELSIELPEATAKAAETRPRSVEVAIDASGSFYVDGRPLINTQSQTLLEALRAAAAEAATAGEGEGGDPPPVIVSADAQTPHQAVVAVMDAARKLGLVRLTFSARLAEGTPP